MTTHSTASAAARVALKPALLRGENPYYSNLLTRETFQERLAAGLSLQGSTDGLTYRYRLNQVPRTYRWRATATALEVELTYSWGEASFTLPMRDFSQTEGFHPILELQREEDAGSGYATGQALYAHHRQLITPQGFTVDEGMAGLLSSLWQEGYTTVYSCEDCHGTAYVAFTTHLQAERFHKAYKKAHSRDERLTMSKLAQGRTSVYFSSSYPKTFPKPARGFTAEGEVVTLTA